MFRKTAEQRAFLTIFIITKKQQRNNPAEDCSQIICGCFQAFAVLKWGKKEAEQDDL